MGLEQTPRVYLNYPMFFIHSDVDKLFINFIGFRTDQANFSINTTGKVKVWFGGGLGFFLNIKLAPF